MRNWTDSTYHNGPVSRTASESGQTDAFLRLRPSISPMRERSVLDCGLRVGQGTAASCRAAESVMLRAFFLAMGISTCIYGAECLVVERFVLAADKPVATQSGALASPPAKPPREMKPPEWAPWSLLATGALVVLYSMAMRRE